MRRVLKLLLSVVLILQLCTALVWAAAPADKAAAETKGTGPAGVWKLCEMTSDGQTVGKEELESYEKLGIVIYMEIREDGTASISGMGEADAAGTWDETSITMEGAAVPYSVEGDLLSIQIGPNSMKFERSTMEAIFEALGYKEGVLDESVEYSKEEETILDNEEISAKITGYQADMTGFTVKVKCENKSDHKLLFSFDDCVLNKYVIDPRWAISLEAGDTRETEIRISPIELARCGISSVDELILSLQLIDSDSWNILLEKEVVTFYPTGKKAEEVKAPDRIPVEGEVVIADDENCLFILQGAGEDPTLGYAINCYYENKTDKPLSFTWSRTTLNGQEVTAIYASEALPGTRGYAKGFFMNNTMEEKGIKADEIKEAAATLEVYDSTEKTPKKILEKDFTYAP